MIKYLTKLVSFAILTYSTLASAGAYNVKEYGIAIIPDEKCIDKMMQLNLEVAKKLPHLENNYNNWYVALYHGAFEPHALKKIAHKLIDIKAKPLDLAFTEIYSVSTGTINYSIKKSANLQFLHEKVVSIAKKFHVKVVDRARDKYNVLPQDKRVQADEYGVSDVMEHYKPHITLFYSYSGNQELTKIAESMAKVYNNGMVCKASSLAINELSYDGRVVKTVETISLEDY